MKKICFIIFLLSALALMACEKKEQFKPSEQYVFVKEEGVEIIDKEAMEFFLLSQYFETDKYAGFSYVDSSSFEKQKYRNAFFVLQWALDYPEYCDSSFFSNAKEMFVNQTYDFSDFGISDLWMYAKIVSILNLEEQIPLIVEQIDSFFQPSIGLFCYDKKTALNSINLPFAFGATWYALHIYDLCDTLCPYYEMIETNFYNNSKKLIESPESQDSLLVLLLLSAEYSFSLYEDKLGIDIQQWLSYANHNLINEDATVDNLQIMSYLYQVNELWNYPKNELNTKLKNINIKRFIDDGYNEEELFVYFYYFDLAKKNELIEYLPVNLENYIEKNIKTGFLIKPQTELSPIYTFYGMELAEIYGFEVSKDKVIKTVISDFFPRSLEMSNTTNSDYVLNTYFSLLLVRTIGIDIDKDSFEILNNNLTVTLRNLTLMDLGLVYSNLYQIQYILECLKMIDKKISKRDKDTVLSFLDYLVENKICENTIMISDIALIYNLLDIELSSKFQEQLEHSKQNLFLGGGYRFSSENNYADLISSAKMIRVMENETITNLQDYLLSFYSNGFIICEDGGNPDLRFVYYFLKLYNRESKND